MHTKKAHSLYLFVLLCFALPLLTGCESRRTIVNAVEEREANEIIVFLGSKNIDATKVRSAETGGPGAQALILWDITVPTELARNAMGILSQHGLPRRKGQSLLGIFGEVGLVPSEMQERIRFQSGLSEQIASTIRKIDGVLDASVQVSFPEEDPLNPGKKKGNITASIYVKHSGVLDDPNTQLVTKIKRLAAASVTGLDIDNVTLISDKARFGEIPIGIGVMGEKEKEFVRIWTIIVGKESVGRFRMVFFSFTLFILILILGFIWMGWKVYPVLKRHGGVGALFNLQPIVEEEEIEEEEEEEEEEIEEEEEEEEEDEEDLTDKKTDVT